MEVYLDFRKMRDKIIKKEKSNFYENQMSRNKNNSKRIVEYSQRCQYYK